MKCPNCGAEVQNKFCEYCRSEMPQMESIINITNNYYNAPQEHTEIQKTATKNSGNKTWLWVLGWICIFPLPLTILLLRKKEMKPAVKYGIITVAWILFLLIGLSGTCEPNVPQPKTPSFYNEGIQGDKIINSSINDTASTDGTPSTGNTDDIAMQRETGNMEVVTESQSTEMMVTAETEEDVESEIVTESQSSEVMVIYAEDDVVNRFISEFNENSAYEITDISMGNIRTKYFGYANGRYLEMINANDAGAEAFCFTINGGQDDTDKHAMYDVFREAVKILDPSITDEMINTALAEFDNKDDLIEGYTIGNSISVSYVPIKELSYGNSSCRIDVYASNYK